MSTRCRGVVLGILVGAALPAQIQVQSVYPPRNSSVASVSTHVDVTFAAPIDPATVTPASVRVFGRWSGPVRGALSVVDGGRTVRFQPARAYFAGERVSVHMASTIATPSGTRLQHGHSFLFWAATRPASRSFVALPGIPLRLFSEPPLGVRVVDPLDLDRDGASDFVVGSAATFDIRWFVGDGCSATWWQQTHALQRPNLPEDFDAHDLDGDGITDLVVALGDADGFAVLFGVAGHLRQPVFHPSGRGTRGIACLDCDGDGDIDVVTANQTSSNLALHRGNGDGTFGPPTSFDGNGDGESAVAAADLDRDGIVDLVVGCATSRSIATLQGLGDGTYRVDALARNQPHTIERVALGDVDRDGAVDAVFSSSIGVIVAYKHPSLPGFYTERYFGAGAGSRSVATADVDGDGFLDVVVGNTASADVTVRWNDGQGGFPAGLSLPGAGAAATCIDRDRDGDLDVLAVDAANDVAVVFRQTEIVAAGAQPSVCAAALRVEQRAGAAGYGSAPPVPITGGRPFFAGISGSPNWIWALFAGIAQDPGTPSPFGLFNLQATPLIALGGGLFDGFGEAQVAIATPGGLPVGLRLAVQGAVESMTLGIRLTNPEVVVTR